MDLMTSPLPNNTDPGNVSFINQTLTHYETHMVIKMAGVLLGLYIVVGNSIIVTAILKYERLRTTTNILIANLSVGDTLLGLLVAPTVPLLQDSVFQSKDICVITLSGQSALKVTSILSVLAISIERFVKVTNPLRATSLITLTRCAVAIAAIWSYGVLCFAAMLIAGKMDSRHPAPCPEPYTIMPIISWVHTWGGVLASGCLYARILFIAKTAQNAIAAELIATNFQAAVAYKKERKLTKKMASIVVILAICLLPSIIGSMIISRLGFVDGEADIIVALRLTALSSSGHNIWFYPGGDQEFRGAVKKMLGIGTNVVHSITS